MVSIGSADEGVQASASVCQSGPTSVTNHPTARQRLELAHETPRSSLVPPSAPGFCGESRVHEVPSKVSATVR